MDLFQLGIQECRRDLPHWFLAILRGPVAFGTVNEVEQDVCKTIEIMMPGGGFVLAPTHQLQGNSPKENVVAMYEAAIKYGRY
jgi:uroporphyrinogen-III decarboxylase